MKLKIFSLIIILLALTAASILYKKFKNQSTCHPVILSNLKNSTPKFYPEKVVVRPWNGRHNVYGVFMLPLEVSPGKTLAITIPKAGTYCGGVERVGTNFEGVQAKPGYYLVKASLKTRTSTLLIGRGFIKSLKDPRNWILL